MFSGRGLRHRGAMVAANQLGKLQSWFFLLVLIFTNVSQVCHDSNRFCEHARQYVCASRLRDGVVFASTSTQSLTSMDHIANTLNAATRVCVSTLGIHYAMHVYVPGALDATRIEAF
jgi:hypothetical protein